MFINKCVNKNIQLTKEQFDMVKRILNYHYQQLCQPNEMAIDYAPQRKAVYDLLEHLQQYDHEGVKRYKLMNGKWVLMTEETDK
jgi:hypothetical protein